MSLTAVLPLVRDGTPNIWGQKKALASFVIMMTHARGVMFFAVKQTFTVTYGRATAKNNISTRGSSYAPSFLLQKNLKKYIDIY
jgi:hypothetical protein